MKALKRQARRVGKYSIPGTNLSKVVGMAHVKSFASKVIELEFREISSVARLNIYKIAQGRRCQSLITLPASSALISTVLVTEQRR